MDKAAKADVQLQKKSISNNSEMQANPPDTAKPTLFKRDDKQIKKIKYNSHKHKTKTKNTSK
jgi:hypothetical protein